MDRIVSLIFHLAAAFFLVYMKLETDQTLARIKEEKGLIIPESDTFGGRAKFFTYLNYVCMYVCKLCVAICSQTHTTHTHTRTWTPTQKHTHHTQTHTCSLSLSHTHTEYADMLLCSSPAV